ncbi:MAG TPA: DUF4214 domain-containing protein [Bryobacteraceae bacterium]|nr:DUF4214 domain-containing protein [Bryobacteraceae bacterium]
MFTKTALMTCLAIGVVGAASPGHDTQFVRQIYTDVLGRLPDRASSAMWVTFLQNGGARIQIASALTSSQEYRKLLVDQVYSDYLNRPPAQDELNFWLAWLQQGATDDQLRAQVLSSDEFFRNSGGTNDQFLNQLFLKVLGVPIDRLALASFNQLLSQGTPRVTVVSTILTSLAAEQRKVEQWCVRFLRASADPTLLANYSAALKAGATDEQIIDLILGSDAYYAFATHGH